MSKRGWIVSVLAHSAAAAYLVWHPSLNPEAKKGEELQTIAIALAPLPVQPPPPPPPPPPVAAPPPPVQEELPVIESKAPEPEPEPEPPPPKPEPPKPKHVERPPPPKPKPPEKKPEPPKPAPEPPQQVVTKPAAEPQPFYRSAPPAPVVAAVPAAMPMPAAPRMAPDPSIEANYLGLLVATLEKHKEYPRRAQQRRQQGTVHLRFVLNRDGSVSNYSVQRSSGHRLLDEAVIEMIQRAVPLPPIPPSLNKTSWEIVLPMNFVMPY